MIGPQTIQTAPFASAHLAVLISSQGYSQTKQLTFGYPAEKNDFHDAAAEIIRTAYERLGVSVTYKTFPAERSLVMSDKGISDGELVRIAGLSAKYPNLIQVPFSHSTVEQMAFALKSKALKISGWKSLAPYKIAYDRGFKVVERNTVGMSSFAVSSHDAAFRMVKLGRVDVVIANRFTGARILQNPTYQNIVMVEPPLQASRLFHYLNARHDHLVQPVAKSLEKMSRDGAIDAIKRKYNVDAGG